VAAGESDAERLEREQAERVARELRLSEESDASREVEAHERRAEKAAYLRERLRERERAEEAAKEAQ
jgi:hypothetical protein